METTENKTTLCPRGSFTKLARYVSVYFWYLRANWLSLMAYPWEFFITNTAGIAYSLGSVAAVGILFTQIKAIGDWGFAQVLLIYGLSILSRSLFHLFWVNLMSLPAMIKDGTFDILLVRPLNPLFQVVAGYLDDDDWGELITAGILIWTSLGMLGKKTSLGILWALSSGIFGSLIFASIHIAANGVSFFTVENSGFTSLAWTLDEFSRYPRDIYGKTARVVITWVFPVAFASFFPAQLLFQDNSMVLWALGTPFVAALTLAAALRFWEFALNHYQGAGH